MTEDQIEYYINQIDDYLAGNLDQAALAEMKTAVEQSPELKIALADHIKVRANLRQLGEKELGEKFKNKFTEGGTQTEKNTTSSRNWFWILALVIGFAGLMLFILKNKSNGKAVELAMLEDPSYDNLRSSTDTFVIQNWNKAVEAFVRKDYESVLSQLIVLKRDSSFVQTQHGKYNLMKGVSELKLKAFEKAKISLKHVSNTNPYFDQAQWYLAMCYYYNNDTKKAQLLLKDISESNKHYKRTDALKFLK